MKYSFPCPECQHSMELSVPQAGQPVVCSACSHETTAPRLGQLRQLPVVEQATTSSKPKAARSGLFVGGLLLALLGWVGGAGLYYYAQTLIVEVDIEEVLDQQEQEFDDQLEAHQVFAFYESLPIEEGLGAWKEQDYVGETKQGQILTKFAYGFFVLGAIGLVLMLAGLRR